jgi:hypothetical protein
MNSAVFDGISRDLGQVATRRGLLRLFGGAAAVGVVAAAGLGAPAKAKRKRRRCRCAEGFRCVKGKCKPTTDGTGQNQNAICAAGSSQGIVSVPATGAAVSTPVLRAGQRYRLRASGFWVTNAQYGNDAAAAYPFADPTKPETSYQGVRLGLSVDGGSPDLWGNYNGGHVYEREVVGQGLALSMRYTDPIPSDNSGSLTVEIFCA